MIGYSLNPSPDLYEERQILQTKYDLLSTEEAENLFLRTLHRIYEFGDKTGKLLAHNIRKMQTSCLVPQLSLSSGITTTDYKEINSQFKQYYVNLYTSESPQDTSLMNIFLDKLNFPTIETTLCDSLDEDIKI